MLHIDVLPFKEGVKTFLKSPSRIKQCEPQRSHSFNLKKFTVSFFRTKNKKKKKKNVLLFISAASPAASQFSGFCN